MCCVESLWFGRRYCVVEGAGCVVGQEKLLGRDWYVVSVGSRAAARAHGVRTSLLQPTWPHTVKMKSLRWHMFFAIVLLSELTLLESCVLR